MKTYLRSSLKTDFIEHALISLHHPQSWRKSAIVSSRARRPRLIGKGSSNDEEDPAGAAALVGSFKRYKN